VITSANKTEGMLGEVSSQLHAGEENAISVMAQYASNGGSRGGRRRARRSIEAGGERRKSSANGLKPAESLSSALSLGENT
jgi:hypothetical protein